MILLNVDTLLIICSYLRVRDILSLLSAHFCAHELRKYIEVKKYLRREEKLGVTIHTYKIYKLDIIENIIIGKYTQCLDTFGPLFLHPYRCPDNEINGMIYIMYVNRHLRGRVMMSSYSRREKYRIPAIFIYKDEMDVIDRMIAHCNYISYSDIQCHWDARDITLENKMMRDCHGFFPARMDFRKLMKKCSDAGLMKRIQNI